MLQHKLLMFLENYLQETEMNLLTYSYNRILFCFCLNKVVLELILFVMQGNASFPSMKCIGVEQPIPLIE